MDRDIKKLNKEIIEQAEGHLRDSIKGGADLIGLSFPDLVDIKWSQDPDCRIGDREGPTSTGRTASAAIMVDGITYEYRIVYDTQLRVVSESAIVDSIEVPR